jgi:predicted transcriptional regulator
LGYIEVGMSDDSGARVGTTTVEVLLGDETHERLREVAARHHRSEGEIAATLIEGALGADELELEIIRQRLSQAEAGGPFCTP